MNRFVAVLAALALGACSRADEPAAGPAVSPPTAGVTDAMIAAAAGGEWLTHGRDYSEQRFSPLQQIDPATIGELGLAWFADLDTARGQEATPLMHDGVLYTSTAWSKVLAFDAATGRQIWAYDPKVPRETLARACCDAVNRGVALYGDKVYVGTLDGRLVALDAKTGKLAWSKLAVPDQDSYTITGAPRAAKGLILIGSGGAEYKARGYLAAFDWATGKEVWRFNVVPGNPEDGFAGEGVNAKAMEAAAKTWGGEWWTLGGGGTVWDSIVYDPRTDLVLFGTGNAEPWNPAAHDRGEGDALYTASVVAVDASTGQYRWHFQETPEDRWDFDSNAPIMLADLEIGGKQRHVALHAPKNGYFYVLDAETGEFLGARPFATQNWTTGIDPKTGKPAINPEARYEKTGKPFIALPGGFGAHSWHPMSMSPQTGLVYIPANEVAVPYLAKKDWKESAIGYQTGLDGAPVSMPADRAVRSQAAAATTGSLLAWDPVKQARAWVVPMKGPWNGGTLATAGGLVFQGNAGGEFVAYDAKTGGRLWSFPAQTGIVAAPMTYTVDGEQYVAVLAGWGGVWDLVAGTLASKAGPVRNISRLLVFKLGGDGKLPAPPPLSKAVLDPPAFKGTAQQVARGGDLYARYCSVCHGDAAVAGGLNPDLRHSGAIGYPDTMKSIVIDGALSHNGMVSFAKALRPADAEAIRHYLVKRANEDKALENRGS
ncbi:PQQ-dependent dehydrogenase, methanol/ethanol family [Tsuneonella sp. YG55]|uniref:PQQ-dependent dehydrogenase, methanol/ethanol family n=1 Tax=Tsuneonella litorea TaxID=2976475 RepID=A0A9X2W3R2_9SPHN|nr:PQQ-dependent dehydrogenase, methanol/ethanol family [Tsuneonella litorea]MCT2560039.1 PQQ-dependent dehydrogenase, methanol/ethanol family [Tsuneonella litorea]